MKFTEEKLEYTAIELFEAQQPDMALSDSVAGYEWEAEI